jgi:hypothetical protein
VDIEEVNKRGNVPRAYMRFLYTETRNLFLFQDFDPKRNAQNPIRCETASWFADVENDVAEQGCLFDMSYNSPDED